MPVEGIANRFRELGRLKFGEDLGDRPGQLRTWRLTSPAVGLIDAAAVLYGGTPIRTETGAELVTETPDLDVLIPPQDLEAGQWFELWGAGGLARRCTGAATVTVDHSGAWVETGPCQCDPAKRACKLRTVLRVLLPELPDLGVWRLSTGSGYAAAELPPAVSAILTLNRGQMAPAVLGLEERTTKRPGQPPNHYVVPILRTRATLAELIAGGPDPAAALGAPDTGAETEAGARSLPPGPLPGSPPHPQNPPTPPETAQIGPESENGAPEGPETVPGRWEPFEDLARFLAETDAGDHGATFDQLIDSLDQLEALMVGTGLWKPGAIDAAAAKEGLAPGWRQGTMVAYVRRLAIRANIAATVALNDHPDGYTAAQRTRRPPP